MTEDCRSHARTLRGQKKGDVGVAETIPQERMSKSMVVHVVDVSVPQVSGEVRGFCRRPHASGRGRSRRGVIMEHIVVRRLGILHTILGATPLEI